jgi:hypothetical protein
LNIRGPSGYVEKEKQTMTEKIMKSVHVVNESIFYSHNNKHVYLKK